MRVPFVTDRIIRLAEKINAEILLEPEYRFVGHITFSNGKTTLFRNTAFNVNKLGSVYIAKDKGYASFFLDQFGFRVPKYKTVFSKKLNENVAIKRSIEDGYKLAKEIGLPVIIKPNDKSKGEGVCKIHNKKEYLAAAKKILKDNSVMLIQEFCEGRDYRIVVLDEEVISAYERTPLTIIGDGELTIMELLTNKQLEFNKIGRDTKLNLGDYRMRLKLNRLNLKSNSILPKGKKVALLDNANLSSGGIAIDFTSEIHSEFRNLAIDITKKMCLRLCGVDILTEDITKPIKGYKIIEINSAPGLDNYGFIGEKQNKIVDDLYLKILLAIQNEK